ncbi:MAG: anti-sigma factor antagonist [Planctomycetes bacterium]|nr:anti-sigma factor antagonist [Planctomycetota bacterium]
MNDTVAPLLETESFELKQQDDTAILELRGDLGSLGWPLPDRLQETVTDYMEGAACRALVVDMSDVEYGGAELLRFLVTLERQVRANGGRFALSGVSEAMESVVRCAGLDRLLPEAEALGMACAAD